MGYLRSSLSANPEPCMAQQLPRMPRPQPSALGTQPSPPRRILVLSRAPVGTMMSSPGIRALNMARVLATALPEARVTLGVPEGSDVVADAPFAVLHYARRQIPALLRD